MKIYGRLTKVSIAVLLGVVGVALVTAQQLSKEYIYVGGRLLAVEVPANTAPPSIVVNPVPLIATPVQLLSSQPYQFQAAVTNAPGATVSWEILNSGPGTLSSSQGETITYTAPASITSIVPVTLRATVDDIQPELGANVAINLVPLVVTINPPAAVPLVAGETHDFTFGVEGGTYSTATWSVVSGPGTFSSGTNVFQTADVQVRQTTVVKVVLDGDPNRSDTFEFDTVPAEELVLTLTNLYISPDDEIVLLPQAPAYIAASFTVQANQAASGVRVDFYLSGNTTIETGTDAHLGAYSFTGPLDETSEDGDVQLLVPGATPLGSYYLIAFVNTGQGELPDTIPCSGNTACSGLLAVDSVSGQGSDPTDLTAQIVVFPPTITTFEAPPPMTACVTNLGADGFSLFFHNRVSIFDSAGMDAGFTKDWSPSIPWLPHNQTLCCTQQYGGCPNGVFPPDPWFAALETPGTYSVEHTVDFLNSVTEVVETNNQTSTNFAVVEPPPTSPDLQISQLVPPAGTSFAPGQIISIESTVIESGLAAVTSQFGIGLYLSTDLTISTSDILLAECTVATLGQGATVDCDRSVTIPAGLATGQYYLGVFADHVGGGFGQIEEDLESNNTLAVAIQIGNVPQVISWQPVSGSGPGFSATAVFSDGDGAIDLQYTYVLINSTLAWAGSCGLRYDRLNNRLEIILDDGSWWQPGGITPGSGVLSNSQCVVPGSGVSVSDPGAGSSLTLETAIVFQPVFAGQKNIYLQALDEGGAISPWQIWGTWNVVAGPDLYPSVTITSPSDGANWPDSKGLISWVVNEDYGLTGCTVSLDGSALPYPECTIGSNSTVLSHAHVPDPSKVLALDFAAAGGGLAHDRSSSGHDGTLVGGPSWVAGAYGSALSFDGLDDHVSFGDVLAFERTDQFTFSFWMRPLAFDRFVIAKQDNWNTGEGYQIYLLADGTLRFALINNQSTNALRVGTTTALTLGSWHYVTATYDGSSQAAGATIYVDGAPAGTTVVTDTLTGTTVTADPFHIGCRESCSFKWFEGDVDELVVYSRELSAQDVSDIFDDRIFDGSHSLLVTATDTSSQTGQDSVAFTIGSGNQAPSVSLSVIGGPFTAPADVTLNAAASDPDGTINRVDFYRDDSMLLV